MAGDSEVSRDEAGSGIEPPIEPRVRRAFGLLERFAPAVGSRWADRAVVHPARRGDEPAHAAGRPAG